jgi:hypothetical protein
MNHGRSAFLVALAASLIVPTAVQAKPAKQYVLKHPKHEHCKAHYTRKVEKVKVREHGRMVKVRETFCVYIVPKKAPVTATTPAGTTLTPTTPTPASPAPIVTLQAHLDPSFVQNPSNPLAVTYSYSASATETVDGVPKPTPSLPSGILNLYSDGLLKCSINVGGSTTGGECSVTSTIGAHTVVTTYISGSTSATETDTEQINPFTTTTTLNVSAPSTCAEHYLRPPEATGCAAYHISASAFDQNGKPVGPIWVFSTGTTAKGQTETGNPVELTLENPLTLEIAASETEDLLNSTHGLIALGALASWSVTAEFSDSSGPAGWSASQSAPQTVNP